MAALVILDYFLTHQAQFLDLARAASLACGALAVAATVWLGALLSTVGGGLLAGLVVASLPLLQAQSGHRPGRYDRAGDIDRRGRADRQMVSSAQPAIVVGRRRRHRRSDGGELPGRPAPGVAGMALPLPVAAERSATEDDRRGSLIEAGAVALAVFLVINPYVVLDFPLFWRWFTFQANVALLRHPHSDRPSLAYYLPVLRDQGVPAMAACAAAVLAATTPWKPAGALALSSILQFAAFSLMQTQYDRFVLPAIVFLSIVGAAWFCAQLARIRPWAEPIVVLLAAPLVLWSAAVGFERDLPGSENRRPDYRLEMFEWIEANVPASATLVIESDSMPLLQTIYESGDRDSPFQDALREAFEKAHPHFVKNIIKTQYIAVVYNYDPKLLEPDGVFFLASSQNRDFIHYNRAILPDPAAFYEALDRRATVVHEGGGLHETLLLYVTGSNPSAGRRALRRGRWPRRRAARPPPSHSGASGGRADG